MSILSKAPKPLLASRPHHPPREKRSAVAQGVLLLGLAYFLLPLLWLLLASTKTHQDLRGSFGLWFGHEFNLFENLRNLFTYDNGVFVIWLRNTAIYALSAAIGSSLIATCAGYAFAMYHFAGRNLLFGIVIASVFVPASTLSVPLYLLLSASGLTNSLLAIILPALINPFGIYMMRMYVEQAVPGELLDAARVDGAGEFRSFVLIIFRLLIPGFVTVLLFSFVGTWNTYFLPLLVLNQPELFPVTLGLAQWNGIRNLVQIQGTVIDLQIITGAVVSTLPLMAMCLLLQRYWQSGATLGSLKE